MPFCVIACCRLPGISCEHLRTSQFTIEELSVKGKCCQQQHLLALKYCQIMHGSSCCPEQNAASLLPHHKHNGVEVGERERVSLMPENICCSSWLMEMNFYCFLKYCKPFSQSQSISLAFGIALSCAELSLWHQIILPPHPFQSFREVSDSWWNTTLLISISKAAIVSRAFCPTSKQRS